MVRSVGAVMGVAALAACVGVNMGIWSPAAQAAKSARPPQRQQLVYQTNFRHGKTGWSSSARGWNAVGGLLTFDGTGDGYGDSVIVAPFHAKLTNYAVEGAIQLNRDDSSDANGFGLVIRSSRFPGVVSGIFAGYSQDCCDNSDSQNLTGAKHGEIWYGAGEGDASTFAGPTNLGQADFDPGGGWHTYRLEVRGISLRLSIDGQTIVQTTSSRFLSGHYVGLLASGNEVSVRVFKVYRLS